MGIIRTIAAGFAVHEMSLRMSGSNTAQIQLLRMTYYSGAACGIRSVVNLTSIDAAGRMVVDVDAMGKLQDEMNDFTQRIRAANSNS